MKDRLQVQASEDAWRTIRNAN